MDGSMMRRAIERKREGDALDDATWEATIAAYMDGTVDDAQMAALAMACVWRGLDRSEAAALTRAMVASGASLQYPRELFVVDKHSSGGVSDIVSLVAVPLVAACGVKVAKLSGRALGHTGGTIDKLETIAGLRTTLAMDAFTAQVERVGCAIAAQSEAFVPADKRLYRLRDHTATVPSIGLIAASIVSKKVAGGAHAFVFDVKCGTAAFMRDVRQATELAQTLVAVSQQFGRRARAVVSDMSEPLGRSIGTGIEVIEARDFLRGEDADARVRDGCLQIATEMLALAGVSDPRATALGALRSGAAYEKFIEMIEAQGGSRAALEAMRVTARAHEVKASHDGFVTAIDAVALGHAAREWSTNEPTGGIRVAMRVGARVAKGDLLAVAYGAHASAKRVAEAFMLGGEAPAARPLAYATI